MWSTIQSRFSKIASQGLTDQQLAKALTVGFLGGLFPVVGLTTALCSLIAIRCRLNLIAVCFANFAVFPLQIALIYLFLNLGQRVLGRDLEWELLLQIDLHNLSSFLNGMNMLWKALLKAVAVWLLTSAVLYLPLFTAFYKLLGAYRRRYSSTPNNSTAF